MTSETARPITLRFETSVAAELLFLLGSHNLPEALGRRVADFWGDGVSYWELLVIADEASSLVGPIGDAASVLSGWVAACKTVQLDPPLRSEPDHDREVIKARLRRLQADKRLRQRYFRLIGQVWALFEQDWSSRQLPALFGAIERCRIAESRGAPWHNLLKGSETASEIVEAGWARAQETGSVTIGICAYGGSLVIDLPGTQFLAMSIKDRGVSDRARTAALARRLRAVADPTRLALLQLLGSSPHSIGELAVELAVSQPTVSNHVKLLREAGLVTGSDHSGRRHGLVVDQAALKAVFQEIAELLLR
ncbi:MAG: ArsR/SmtB family transcription factor [Acidimicrobiales bacterium]